MIRLLLIALLSISLFGNDLWQLGFQQGTSIFNIENSKKERLSFECGYTGAGIYLYNKGKDVNLKDDSLIDFVINDEKKLSTVKNVSLSKGTMSDMTAWGNLVYEIPNAKKIIVEANNQKFTFEPSNLKELQYFVQACTEYQTSENTSSSKNTTTSSNATTSVDVNKQPFKLDLKREYNEIYKMAYPMLVITSLDDKLVIKDIKVNKGKCNAIPLSEVKQNINGRVIVNIDRAKLPVSVPEYEALKVNITSGCNVLRLDIDTNSGSWTFGEN